MKTYSERSDVAVVGATLGGICCSVSAAREGAVVHLIDQSASLGGKIGREIQFPLDYENCNNFAYQRETGILDELLYYIHKNNTEGNYAGFSRALFSWLESEARLKIFLDTRLFDVEKNSSEDKISFLKTISSVHSGCTLFRSKYFIDCSEDGSLSQLAGAPGEKGLDQNEFNFFNNSQDSSFFRAAASMQIKKTNNPSKFFLPDWVKLRWEDNHPSAKIELLKSLGNGFEGVHHVEWIGNSKDQADFDSNKLIWSAWDYLKNRSQIVGKMKNLTVENFSPIVHDSKNFRPIGEYTLSVNDLEIGKEFYDTIAVGRSPLDSRESLICSSRGKIGLPHPFEVPLRSLISKKIKNLFFVGQVASSTSRVSPSLGHPSTSSQMGTAAGVCAASCIHKKRLPRTIAKPLNVEVLRKKLVRQNHNCGRSKVEDTDNLIPNANIIPSSVLNSFGADVPYTDFPLNAKKGLIQFPVSGDEINEIKIFLSAEVDSTLSYRVYESSSNGSTIPGLCLGYGNFSVKACSPSWQKISVDVKIENPGWHFFEFYDNNGVQFYFQKNAPVGILYHNSLKNTNSGFINPYSEYFPFTPNDFEAANGVFIEICPSQAVYSSDNVKNGKSRPDFMPNLWISENTDFRFPEYLEFHWEEEVELSLIEIVWDSSLDKLHPIFPIFHKDYKIETIISNYKIYYMNNVGHWVDLLEVSGNESGFSSHKFEDIKTRAIELEIQKTNGAPRAQIYEVRAYS